MHGKLACAAFAVTFLLSTHATNNAIADKKTDAKSEVKAKSESKKAGAAKRTAKDGPQKASTKATAATKPSQAADKSAKPAPAPTTVDVADDVPWYERPLTAPAKATEPAGKTGKEKEAAKAKAKAKPEAAERGGAIGLGSRSGRTPVATADEAPQAPKLDRNAVIKTLRANEASFAYCRAKAERRGEKAAEMILSFRVDASGRAAKISVSDMSGAKAPAMSSCLSRRMKSWSFPAKTAGGAIEYPLMVQQIGPASK